MRGSWKKTKRRVAVLTLVLVACFFSLAVPALATEYGQVWLDWVYEPANAGIHAKYYNYFEQAASEITSGVYSCANGWLGYTGGWVFGRDCCNYPGYQATTPALRDPGEGAYPWAQTAGDAEYLWGWAGYCGNC